MDCRRALLPKRHEAGRHVVTGCPLHNLILRVERHGVPAVAACLDALSRLLKDQQLSGVHRPRVPRPQRGGLYLRPQRRCCFHPRNELAISEYAFETASSSPARPSAHRQKGGVGRLRAFVPGGRGRTTSTGRGHSVTVYEAEDRAGGLLMYGIPNMKLDKEIVRRRTELMAGRAVTLCDRRGRGGGAVEAKGACWRKTTRWSFAAARQTPGTWAVPGRDAADGVHFAVDFLKATPNEPLNTNLNRRRLHLRQGPPRGGGGRRRIPGNRLRGHLHPPRRRKKRHQIEMMPCRPPARGFPRQHPGPSGRGFEGGNYGQQGGHRLPWQ
jgi:glutamate synthase (NADPH/NADH) small chain